MKESHLRANLLMNGLFKVLSIDNGTDFSCWIGCPIWCHNFDFWFACVNTVININFSENVICVNMIYFSYRFDVGSADGFELAFGGFAFGLFCLAWRLFRMWPKNDSPPIVSSVAYKFNSSLKGAVMSGMPGKLSYLFASRFRRDVCIGGSLNCCDRKSPYIRLISALFSSINSSIRSLNVYFQSNSH